MAQREGTLTLSLCVSGPRPAKRRRFVQLVRQKVLRSIHKENAVHLLKVTPRLNQMLNRKNVPRVLKVHWSIQKKQRKGGRNWEEALIDGR
jgi:hypothetical protein